MTREFSAVHAILDRHGLVRRRCRARRHTEGTTLPRSATPSDHWYAGYKGEFMLSDHRYCYLLAFTDFGFRSPFPNNRPQI